MKKILVLLALYAFAASCNESGRKTNLERENDSLNKTIGKFIGVMKKYNIPIDPDTIPPQQIQTYYVSLNTANKYVSNWGTFLSSANIPSNFVNNNSFIIPLSTVGRMIQKGYTHAVFYICMDTINLQASNSFSMVYTGGIKFTNAGIDSLLISPIDTVNGVAEVFNNTWPCPVCDVKWIGQSIQFPNAK